MMCDDFYHDVEFPDDWSEYNDNYRDEDDEFDEYDDSAGGDENTDE